VHQNKTVALHQPLVLLINQEQQLIVSSALQV